MPAGTACRAQLHPTHQLAELGEHLDAPVITGETSVRERERLFELAWKGGGFTPLDELTPEQQRLIDTYDTLGSGLRNAIEVGRGLVAQGKSFGVRLDSGDIDYLSREVRRILDAEGLPGASIVVYMNVSNNPDAHPADQGFRSLAEALANGTGA